MSEISDSDIGAVGDMVDDLVIQTTYRLYGSAIATFSMIAATHRSPSCSNA
jgi:hypothetical protein